MCKGNYGLDLCHHFSSAGLAWDAMLKMTRIELELLTDIDKFFFIEKGMRGGISYIARRHVKANNKQVEGYDESKPTKHMIYLDANNLYGWGMSQYLPKGGFRWMTREEIEGLDLSNYKEDSEKGLILEVE